MEQMTNEELIYNLRYCFEKRKTVVGVPWYVWCDRAADAIQTLCDELETYHAKSVTDEKRIVELNTKCADLQSQINEMENEIEELLPKEGEWIRKEVKVYCPRDCWNPSACAIEGTWNEEEGWNLEMQDGFCSVCGEQDEEYYKHHYCPNCGSKMKKGEQE